MSYYINGLSSCSTGSCGNRLAASTPTTTVSCAPVTVTQQSVTTNRLANATARVVQQQTAPANTVTYFQSSSCGTGTQTGLGSTAVTVSKSCLGTGSGTGCGSAVRPGYAASIGKYAGNPGIQYCTINSDEFCPLRISSGTYSSLANNAYNASTLSASGLQFSQASQFTCGLSSSNLTQFATHWFQIGTLFKISGIAGMQIIQTANNGYSGTTGNLGNVPFPQFLINLPITTTITQCATITGMAAAYVVLYPFGQPFSTVVSPVLVRTCPIFYSLRLGCTATDSAGILLTVYAPVGLNGGVQFDNSIFTGGVTPALIIQFEITIDIGGS